jgi:peptidyl-prolyl cis-trans isomerase B (cyclophilin B)
VSWSLPGWTAALLTLDVIPDLSAATADIETTAGTMSARFHFEEAPRSVANFVRLAEDGYYAGTLFHRVIPGFMIQGGDPNSKDDNPADDGGGGPEWTVPGEMSDVPHVRGTLSMARNGDQVFGPLRQVLPNVLVQIFGLKDQAALDALMAELDEGGLDLSDRQSYLDSAGSQFFVVHQETPRLDGQYTNFGILTGGLDVLDTIAATATTGSTPTPPTTPDRPLTDQKILSVTIHRSGGNQ